MRISLQKFFQITTAATLLALTLSSSVSAQMSEVDAMYEANSTRPLGGLFAKGFTRTFTLLGGANFATAEVLSDFPGQPPSGTITTNFPGASLSERREEITDSGYAISGAMGRRHSKRLRSEIEFAIRGNELSTSSFPELPSTGLTIAPRDGLSADVRAYSLMKNVIFELPNRTRFTPYGGAGIGISWIDVDVTRLPFFNTTTADEISEDDTALTYQAIGGVSAQVNQAMDFVVEYRFLGTGEIEFDSIGNLPYQVSNLFLGMKLEY